MALVGYFTIALKPLTVQGEKISNTIKRKVIRVSEFDSRTQTYTMSAYLIAQLGRNYSDGGNKEITGAEFLELAFYQDNKFRQFDTRLTTSNPENQHELIQLLRLL